MQEVADSLDTIHGLRVSGFPAKSIQPPAAVVTWPEDITYDKGYARGMDTMDLWVIVLVGDAQARTSRDLLGKYADGGGSSSVKQAIEAKPHTSFDSARVKSVRFDPVEYGGTVYAAATFTVEIVGRGAS